MKRRDLLAVLAAAVASPVQAAGKVWQVGFLKARQGQPTLPLTAAEFAASTALQAEALQLGLYTAPAYR